MDETGVSTSSKIDGLQASREAASDSPQISVKTYPTSPEKVGNDSDDLHRSKKKSTAQYPYASMFFLLGNTIGQR